MINKDQAESYVAKRNAPFMSEKPEKLNQVSVSIS